MRKRVRTHNWVCSVCVKNKTLSNKSFLEKCFSNFLDSMYIVLWANKHTCTHTIIHKTQHWTLAAWNATSCFLLDSVHFHLKRNGPSWPTKLLTWPAVSPQFKNMVPQTQTTSLLDWKPCCPLRTENILDDLLCSPFPLRFSAWFLRWYPPNLLLEFS